MPAYLVQYGRSAFVGRFTVAEPISLGRGGRVIVRTPRGTEIGTILCEPADRFGGLIDATAGGDVVRTATTDDETVAAARDEDARSLLALADQLAAESDTPLTFLDAEVLFDGTAAVLHVLPWAPCDADPLFAELSARTGRSVRMLDASRPVAPADPPQPVKSCGKSGCGTDGGGCSSCGSGGGCSRKAVTSADDLTAYFAGLRASMEAQAGRMTLN